MAQSHESMRADFEITLPAIDGLVASLKETIGEEGGVRMTGGGFGGCIVAVVAEARADHLLAYLPAGLKGPDGGAPLAFITGAEAGARLV